MGLRRGALHVAIAATAACSCPQVDSTVEYNRFNGVLGAIFTQSDTCSRSGCAAVASGVSVRASSSEGLEFEVTTDADGEFRLALPPGKYDIEIAPPRARIDRSVGVVSVGAAGGVTVIRDYVDSIESDLLTLWFAEDTSPDVRAAVLKEYGLSIVSGTYNDTIILVRVAGEHPQLVGEALMRTRSEVENFTLASWDCPAS